MGIISVPLMISLKVEEACKCNSSRRRVRRVCNYYKDGNGNESRIGRRHILLLLSATPLNSTTTHLLNKYLKKSEENKAKNDKERLDSYYKRNYKDYFGLLEGDLKQKKDLSESEKSILEWLESNK